jgi:hypothetical protein
MHARPPDGLIPSSQRNKGKISFHLHEPSPFQPISPTDLSHYHHLYNLHQPVIDPLYLLTTTMSSISWSTYFAAERATFQRDLRLIIDILLTPSDPDERLSFCHQIASRSSFPGPLSTLHTAIKTAKGTKEHLAQRHLTANINCLTDMFIDHPKEGRSRCFRSRLIIILDYCRRLCEQCERAGRVAGALDLVVLLDA